MVFLLVQIGLRVFFPDKGGRSLTKAEMTAETVGEVRDFSLHQKKDPCLKKRNIKPGGVDFSLGNGIIIFLSSQ